MKDNLVETLVGAAVLVVAAMFVIYGYSVTEADSGDGYSPVSYTHLTLPTKA